MKDSDLRVRGATMADALALAELLGRVFAATYEAAIPPELMAAYLEETFSPQRVVEELAESEGVYLLAEVGGALVGVSRLAPGDPAGHQLSGPVELVRLYVDGAFHGRGVGGLLLAHTLATGRAQGYGTVWLSVWERNGRALAFYSRHGFATFGRAPYMVGDIRFDDLLMRRSLDDR